MNEARVELQANGQEPRVLKREALKDDQFTRLATPGAVHSNVGFHIGTQHNFGEFKILAIVTLSCDQNEAVLDRAAELALLKAMEYATEGFKILAGSAIATQGTEKR
jgi:hypothetical protein